MYRLGRVRTSYPHNVNRRSVNRKELLCCGKRLLASHGVVVVVAVVIDNFIIAFVCGPQDHLASCQGNPWHGHSPLRFR